jgi:hypothetical protein
MNKLFLLILLRFEMFTYICDIKQTNTYNMKAQIEGIKQKLSNGEDAFWKSNRISQIKFDSLNMGGKLKIRLESSTRNIEIDINEITFK